jgi:hypothetical protein
MVFLIMQLSRKVLTNFFLSVYILLYFLIVGRVFGDTHCVWEQWGVTVFSYFSVVTHLCLHIEQT